MKIGINVQALGTQVGGDETYIRNVVRGLAAVDPGGDYTLFFNSHVKTETLPPGFERMRAVVLRPSNPLIRLPLTFPLALAHYGIDVVHVQYVAPPLCPAQVVVSVHDIAYERYPQFFTPSVVMQFRASVPLTIRHAAAVLTLSTFSKRDIVRRYGTPPDKIVVAPCAADPSFQPIHDQDRLVMARARYRTGERFILCVGNLQPRKNLKTLIDAYVRLRQADATRHKLVLVGRQAWLHKDIFAAARVSGYADELVFTGYVPQEDLVALYNAADLFVYPSIFEGFGLPPLEAMACGTPVITSNTSALPETVGDAALMVNPLDADALASVMATVLHDDAMRDRFATLGLRRAAAFSWEATARIVLDTYRRAVQR